MLKIFLIFTGPILVYVLLASQGADLVGFRGGDFVCKVGFNLTLRMGIFF